MIGVCTVKLTKFKDCSNCKYKEYKGNKKSTLIKKSPIKGKKHKITKETEISKNVKMTVWERDNIDVYFVKDMSTGIMQIHIILNVLIMGKELKKI